MTIYSIKSVFVHLANIHSIKFPSYIQCDPDISCTDQTKNLCEDITHVYPHSTTNVYACSFTYSPTNFACMLIYVVIHCNHNNKLSNPMQ